MADINPKFPLIQFPFSAGIDEAQRAEVVEAGSGWLTLENGRQDQRGGYSTRPGFTFLLTGRFDSTNATAGYKLFSDGTTAVRITDTLKAEAYSSQAGAWKDLGRVPEIDYSYTPIPNVSAVSTPEDIAYCNGYFAITSTVTSVGFPRIVIMDAATSATVSGPIAIGVTRPLLASFSSRYFIALYVDPTSLKVYILDTLTAASIQAGWSLLATVGVDYLNESVAIESLSDRVVVGYVNSSGGTDRVTLKSYDQTGLLQSTTINTASAKPITLDIRAYPGATTLWVAWSQGLPLKMCGVTTTSLSTVVSTTSTVMTATTNWGLVSISPSAASVGRIIGNEGTGSVPRVHMIGFQNSAGATAVVGAQVDVQCAGITARAFYYGSRHYVPASGGLTTATLPTGNGQKNFIVVDWTDDVTWLRPVANLVPGLAVVSTFGKSKCVVGPTSSTLYITCAATQSGVGDAGLLVALDFASLRRWQAVPHGNSTFLPSGLTAYTDSLRVAEVGFLVRPTLPTSTFTATGITGSFRYVAVYEEVDGDGNWHISGVSDPSAVISPANQTVNISTAPLTITARIPSGSTTAGSLRIAFYRTLTGGVAPYYRVGFAFLDTTTITNTCIDAMTDATLATQAKLYAQPGVLGTSQDRRPPPGLGLLTSYNGMLVGAAGSDVWFSGQNVTGEGVWFNPIFQVPVPGAGDITALAVMDGTLFVFKRREVFAIAGDAPSDNGASGGLGLPRRLACDVGAISSVTCVTALGIFFQSDRGLEILTRAQTVDWIGEAVLVTYAAYPVVTSMTVDPLENVVLVELAASSSAGLVTGNGRTCVYDLSLRTWVSVDRRNSVLAVPDAPSQSACMIYTGAAWRYAWLSSTGYVHVQSTTSSLDADGSFVAKRAVSAHVKGSGMLGLQHVNRAQLLAKRNDPHDLRMSVAYDYNASFTDTRTWTNAELAAFTLPNQQLEHTMGNDAECQAVSVQLLDVTPSSGSLTTGKAATWIGLCFEVVPRAGAYKLPDTSR